jgi:chemotaxis protein CheY-P-specific phosphatase CheC
MDRYELHGRGVQPRRCSEIATVGSTRVATSLSAVTGLDAGIEVSKRNVLRTTIDMSTPSFVYGRRSAVIEQMGGWSDQKMVIVLDSETTADGSEVHLTVYTFPQLEPLVAHIQDIEVDTDVHADTVA